MNMAGVGIGIAIAYGLFPEVGTTVAPVFL